MKRQIELKINKLIFPSIRGNYEIGITNLDLDEKEIIKSALKIANITGVGAYSNYGFGHYYIVDENVIEKDVKMLDFDINKLMGNKK